MIEFTSMHYHDIVFAIFSDGLMLALSFVLFLIYMYKGYYNITMVRERRDLYARAFSWLVFCASFGFLVLSPDMELIDQRAVLRVAFSSVAFAEVGYNLYVIRDLWGRVKRRLWT